MHAPSVGEGLQARPVIELARTARPEMQLAYTWFSPSADHFGHSLGADIAGPLPFDTAANADALLDAMRPTALVCAKADLWPLLAAAAHARGVPLGLVSATLGGGSSRLGMARALLGDAYAALDVVGAIDNADAARLVALGVRADRVSITGDTRYDQVWGRAQAVDLASAMLAPLADARPTLVAGSTWPADEARLLVAWNAILKRFSAEPATETQSAERRRLRLIIAPHEPVPAHLDAIEQWAQESGLTVARLDGVNAARADVVLVDRVGVLGDLYSLATAAFVGGGFHAAGLHSVLEPAAFGVPVVFGPRHQMSRDAARLMANGGGESASSCADIERILAGWLGDAASRSRAGDKARAVVMGGLGAAGRSWELVAGLIDAGR